MCTYYGTSKYNFNTGKYFVFYQTNKFSTSPLISYKLNYLGKKKIFKKKVMILNNVFISNNIINLVQDYYTLILSFVKKDC